MSMVQSTTLSCKRLQKKRKICFIILSLSFVTVTTLLLNLGNESPEHSSIGNNITTPYHKKPIPGENHIIFIETSCTVESVEPPKWRGLLLTPRQACSIESAAKANPNASVYLLYTCPIIGNLTEASKVFVRHLLEYPNVRLHFIDLYDYFTDTPLELFYSFGGWDQGKWPKEQSSDVLRYLTLWKYGGTYLDLDMIVLRSIEELGTNFVGAEDGKTIASAVLNFNMATDIGRRVVRECMGMVGSDFVSGQWGHIGPLLMTRVITDICNSNKTVMMTPRRCSGFKVYQKHTFCPVHYGQPYLFYNALQGATLLKLIRRSYMVHTWNYLTSRRNVTVGSVQPFGLLAQRFCPNVYHNCGPTF